MILTLEKDQKKYKMLEMEIDLRFDEVPDTLTYEINDKIW